MAKVCVVIGENKTFNNISARAAYSTREAAEKFDRWFDDRVQIVELELDAEAAPRSAMVASISKQLAE